MKKLKIVLYSCLIVISFIISAFLMYNIDTDSIGSVLICLGSIFMFSSHIVLLVSSFMEIKYEKDLEKTKRGEYECSSPYIKKL